MIENYSNTTGNWQVPVFVVYYKLLAVLPALAVGIPNGLVICVIVRETELHTKY